jgi:tetratricopeptide (TPR) repeat protein
LGLRASTLGIGFSAPDGADASASLRLVPPDADSVVLDNQNAAQAVWLLAPEDSSQLPPGQYVLRLTLDATQAAAPGEWNGSVVAAPVQVEVKDPPAPLPDNLDAELALAQSHYRELTDDPDGALAVITSLLERQPDNLGALARQADLFFAAGRFPEAAQAYSAAIVRFHALFPDATHEPRQLLRARSEAQWRAAGLDP